LVWTIAETTNGNGAPDGRNARNPERCGLAVLMHGVAGRQCHCSTSVMVIQCHGVPKSMTRTPSSKAVAGQTMAAHVEQVKTKCQAILDTSMPRAAVDSDLPTKVLGNKAHDCHAKPAKSNWWFLNRMLSAWAAPMLALAPAGDLLV
jgi:hypothetical protein